MYKIKVSVQTLRCRFFIALALPIFSVSLGSALAQDRGDAELSDKDIEKIMEITNRPEWVWLRDGREQGQAESFQNGGVYFSGYYPEAEITPDRLAVFQKNLLFPNLLLVEHGTEKVESLQVAWWTVPGHPEIRCGGLIQIVTGKNSTSSGDTPEQLAIRATTHLPTLPLTKTCQKSDPPPMPAGFIERRQVEYYGLVLRDNPQSCRNSATPDRGQIKLARDTRIEFRRIISGEKMPQGPYHQLDRFFDAFIAEFILYVRKNGAQDYQLFIHQNYEPRQQDITLEMRLVESPAEDLICYIVDVKQGEASRRFVRSEQRNGRSLAWNRVGHHDEIYAPGRVPRDFGTAVAEAVKTHQPLQ